MTKFNVGDRVERIRTANSEEVPKGKRGTVEVTGTRHAWVRWDGLNRRDYNFASNLKLLPAEIVVGSRVACDDYQRRGVVMYGTVSKITPVTSGSGDDMIWCDNWTIGIKSGWSARKNLRLARPGEEVPKELFTAPERPAPRVPHPQTAGTYIVVKAEDGKLLPNAEPRVHFTAADAKKEAARLAEKHGGTFLVMVAAFRTEGVPETTYVVKTTSV